MTNVLIYLASNYPDKDQRKEIEKLDLTNKNLEGELDFTNLGFSNLKRIELQNNKITKLILTNPQQITHFDVSNNKLTELNITYLDKLVWGNISNNPLPVEVKHDFLKKRWDYWKQINKLYPGFCVPGIMEVVDIKDMDDFITNYDFDREGNQEYHQIVGGAFTSMTEFALQQLSQQVLARALIKQNRLVNGEDEPYEREINNLARQFQKVNSMHNQYPLELVQRELQRELRGSKDLQKEFQRKLLELEALLDPNQTPNYFDKAVDFQKIKEKIWNLQDTVNQQREELKILKQSFRDKEVARQALAEDARYSAEKYQDIEKKYNSLLRTSHQMEEKLEQMEEQEKDLQHRLTILKDSSVLNSSNLKAEYTNLLNQKGEYIQQLEKEIKELKTKSKMKDQETQTEPNTFNYKKWGVIGIITLLIIGLLVWCYRRIRI